MVARSLRCLLALALCAGCSSSSPSYDRDGSDSTADGSAGDGADGADEDGADGAPEDGATGDGGGGMDGGLPGSDGGLDGGQTDGGSEEGAPDEFFTSFETIDPQPTWTNTVETTPDGAAKSSGVTGNSDSIPGSVMGQVASVYASAENVNGEVGPNVADGEVTTKWLAFTNQAYVVIELIQPAAVRLYTVTSANDAPERDPRDWTLEGSSDGSSWNVVDSRTGQSFSERFQTKQYEFANDTSYRFYRFNIGAVQDGGILQVAELQLSTGDDVTGTDTPMKSEVGRGPGSSWNAKLNAGFTGVRAFRYGGRVTSTGRGYATNQVFDVDLKVTSKSELSYLIFPDETANDPSYASTFAGLDLAFDDGTYLSELGAVDQHFAAFTPAGQGASKTLLTGEWNRKVVRIGKVAAGKRIKRILVGVDHPDGPVTFGGWVDDIRIGAPPALPARLSDYAITTRGTNSSSGFSRGNTFPATALPHGFNFWTPCTNAGADGWLYSYHRDNNVDNLPLMQAFSLSHQPSPWMGDRQSFQVMPSRASGVPNASRTARALPFKHENEVARPYYYGVTFENGIRSEMTPTDHAAVFRFTFPTADASLIFDHINASGGLTLDPESRALSFFSDARSGLSAGATRIFVYATFDRQVTASAMLSGGGGDGVTGYYRFTVPSDDRTVTMRIATSLISVEQAKKNLALEIAADDTFDTVKARAQDAWDEKLSVIEVEGANLDQKTTLYSNLYRLFLYPNSAFENIGTNQAPSYRYASPVSAPVASNTPTQTGARINSGKIYVNNGFWDTYRATWPALALLSPTQAGELIDGFVQQYKDGGWISRWSSPGYADLMTGTSSDVAFADAYLKGVTNFDVKAAYDAALRSAMVVPASGSVGRKGNETSIFRGYTSTATGRGMSWAMAGYLNDFGIANMAQALAGNAADPRHVEYGEYAEYLRERSRNYVNMFDPAVGFFQGRGENGAFRVTPSNFEPRDWGNDYEETNAWNMAFDAPHDGRGLANLHGGADALAAKLDAFFSTPETANNPGGYGGVIHEMREARDVRMGQLGLSNQPSFHIPYMYLFAGQPAKTQATVREALARLWVGSDIGQGYLGDEDNGALSAWQIFGALGFYPLQVGSASYVIGSPLFTKATVHLENGHDIVINAPANSARNVYVQSLKVNGASYTKTYLPHSLLSAGAVLDFEMGDAPSAWGTGEGDAPPSLTAGSGAPAPLVDITGQAEAATSAEGTNVAGLFDDTSATRVTFGAANPTLLVTFTSAAEVTFYTLTSGPSAADPSGWSLSGSNDGATWTLLDQRSGQTFSLRSQTRVFKVGRPGPYSRYRLTLVSSASANLAEVELLARP